MASSVAQAELRREKVLTVLIFTLFLIAFGITFKPIRLVQDEQFVDCYFVYRYEKSIGPGQRPKEEIRGNLQKRMLDEDLAPDAYITFPTTTEIKIRVPLQSPDEAASIDQKIQELLDEVVPEQYGQRIGNDVDLTGFPETPLARFGNLGLYRPKLHLNLGLDLQGGVHLVLKARTQNVEYEYKLADTAAQLTAAVDAAEKKLAEAAGEEPTAEPADEPTEEPTAEPAADAAAESDEPADDTQPDGGQPLRLAQLPDDANGDTTGETDEDAPLESLEETVVSPEEAKLLADENLRQRVVDVIAELTIRLRKKYGERIGDVYGEVVGSNIAIFRTFVDPKDPKASEHRLAHARIIEAELKDLFPEAKPKFEKPAELPIPKDAMKQVKEVIVQRIDRLGVAEAEVRTHGADRVVVELPGIKDPDEAVNLIGTTARLEFRKVPPRYRPEVSKIGLREETTFVIKGTSEAVPSTLVYYEAPEFEGNKNIMVGSDLAPDSATVTFTQQREPAVSLNLRSRAAKRFDRFAQDNYKEYLAIYLDRQVISAPVMKARHFGGQIQISGGFDSVQEANRLKILLNAGALPVPVDVVEQRTVSATLGADAVRQSFRAGLCGILLIVILMAVLYRVPGILANVALLGYLLLVLACLVMFNATLTLPGILGLILSIGMAVDANVIVFERLKEELRQSTTRPIASAIKNSYERALTAIVDGNITTLLVAAVLFFLGTGPIRGFAVTLSVGILCSMFSALIVTRRFQILLTATALGANRRIYRS